MFCDFLEILLLSPFLVNNVEIAGYYQLFAVDILSRAICLGFIILGKIEHPDVYALQSKR